MTLLSPSELLAALPSSHEEDKALLRSHRNPMQMTDDQAKAICEAGNRIYLRHQYSRNIGKEFIENYTDDFRIYPDTKEDPLIGHEKLSSVSESIYGNGTVYMTAIEILEVFRAGDYLIEWSTYMENDSNRGYFAVQWRFDNGQWRRMRDIFN